MRCWLCMVAFLALLAATAGALQAQSNDSILSEPAFVHEFERITAEKYRDAVVRASKTQIEVRFADGSSATFFPANAYAKYRVNPSQLKEIVLAHIAKPGASAKAADAAGDRSVLLPVVRSKAWLGATRSQLLAAGASEVDVSASLPISIDIGEDLVLVFAEDSADNVRFLGPTELAQFKLASAEEARTVALDNLRKKLPAMEIEGRAGRYKLHLDGTYESSLALVLNDKTWAGLGLKGRTIVALPSRDTALLCGSDDKESVATLREYAKKLHGSADHPISPRLYELRDGRFYAVE